MCLNTKVTHAMRHYIKQYWMFIIINKNASQFVMHFYL
jgi:hypothetical protein